MFRKYLYIFVIGVLFAAAGCAGDESEGTTLDQSGDATTIDVTERTDVPSTDDVEADPDVPPVGDDIADDVDDDVGPDAGPAIEEDAGPPPEVCPAGLSGCVEGERFVCADDGSAFEIVPCEAEQTCFDGGCVACITDEQCPEPTVCEANECVVEPLTVLTTVLPDGLVGVPYLATFAATGGTPPYEFNEVDAQAWPVGVLLGVDGAFGGVPQTGGEWELTFEVTDSAGETAQATVDFTVSDAQLAITTPSPLPTAVEGEGYSAQLEASGGTEPYFFGALDPLPAGLLLTPGGMITGIAATDVGLPFTIKVFDNGAPTLSASKTFEIPIQLAPLEIIADQELDLFITKLITLPTIIVTSGFPVPYNTQLTAKGGKKPYMWTDVPLANFILALIPGAGLPDGLTVAADGTVSGAVTDPSLVLSVTIPFTQITLNGFFFAAEVADSQDPSETATAAFFIPAVPL